MFPAIPVVPAYSAPVNWAAPLNRGLLGWWKTLPMRYGGLVWSDLTGKNPATFVNVGASTATSGWNSTQRVGGSGELRMAGSTAYADAGSRPPITSLPQLTFTCWVKLNSYGGSTLGRIVDKRDPASGWVLMPLSANGGLQMNADFTTGAVFQTPSLLGLAAWYHVGVTYDNSSLSNTPIFYVNGAGFASTATTAPTGTPQSDSGANLKFGNQADGTRGFDGAMDDARLYGRLLSATEMRDLYQASRLGHPRELRWTAPAYDDLRSLPPPPRPWRRILRRVG